MKYFCWGKIFNHFFVAMKISLKSFVSVLPKLLTVILDWHSWLNKAFKALHRLGIQLSTTICDRQLKNVVCGASCRQLNPKLLVVDGLIFGVFLVCENFCFSCRLLLDLRAIVSMRSKLLVPNLPAYRLLNQYLSASVGNPFIRLL